MGLPSHADDLTDFLDRWTAGTAIDPDEFDDLAAAILEWATERGLIPEFTVGPDVHLLTDEWRGVRSVSAHTSLTAAQIAARSIARRRAGTVAPLDDTWASVSSRTWSWRPVYRSGPVGVFTITRQAVTS